MSSDDHGYVADVPYVRSFVHELAPAWLDHVATLRGFRPPSRADLFAWCDLGCGQGVTAALLAATHPSGWFCGVDAMPSHIEHARRLASDLGLENVCFHEVDFSQAAASDLPGFDYITAHGVYSWIDAASRAALMHFVDRHLKPGGLFYLSYNALPGRAADLPLQRLTHALGRTFPGGSVNRLGAAVAVVETLADLKAPALTASPMLERLRQYKSNTARAYLAHELMGAHWEPLCVTEVRAAARAIGLVPVGSATLMENFDSFVLGGAARTALAAITDEDTRELARDFLIDQFFRRDVFWRDGERLFGPERQDRLFAATYALRYPANRITYAMHTPAGQLAFDNAAARAVVSALSRRTCSLAEMVAEAAVPPSDLIANTLVLCAADAVWPVDAQQANVSHINRLLSRRWGSDDEIGHLVTAHGTALPIAHVRKADSPDDAADAGDAGSFLAAHGIVLTDDVRSMSGAAP